MKRVECCGMLDSQNLSARPHSIAPPAIHPSGTYQPAPGALVNGHGTVNGTGTRNGRSSAGSQGSDRSVHRSDTLSLPHPRADIDAARADGDASPPQ